MIEESGCQVHPGLPQGQAAWTRDGAKQQQNTGTPPVYPQGRPCQEHTHPRRTEDIQTQTQTQQQDEKRSLDDSEQQSRQAQQLGPTQKWTQEK
ncbi:unnamed protein product, partial [Closterium sp. NIES-54]